MALCVLWLGVSIAQAKPVRVVSINLCTDQLALLLAEPGQLLSVSPWGHRKDASVLWREARQLPANRALAEEVFLLNPDVVLAGAYTAKPTVQMLQRLGRQVEIFHPSHSMQGMMDNVKKMGNVLGVPHRADALVDDMQRRLAQLRAQNEATPLEVAGYGANNYTGGKSSLEQSLIEAAGLSHYGSQRGIFMGAELPLEKLILDPPDILMMSARDSEQPGRAYETLSHPALVQRFSKQQWFEQSAAHWVCGGPFVLDEIERLARFASESEDNQ